MAIKISVSKEILIYVRRSFNVFDCRLPGVRLGCLPAVLVLQHLYLAYSELAV